MTIIIYGEFFFPCVTLAYSMNLVSMEAIYFKQWIEFSDINTEHFLNLGEEHAEDAKEILQGKAYHWHDWNICRGRDCLYVWSDSAALELSNGSNGWFRFILDGKLATMYSSGSPENGNDNSGMSSTVFFFLSEDRLRFINPVVKFKISFVLILSKCQIF